MVDDFRTLLALVLVFVPLSLLSIGGGASLLADMEYQSVSVHGWTTPREFADLFAISRAAPGPGTMLSTLIGWKAAGWAGAITATVALYLPSSLLVFCVARLWGRWRGSVWHSAVERGLAPVAAGLMLSGGIAVLRVSPGGPALWAAAVIATVLLLRWPRLHPLVLFAASGALFGFVASLNWLG
jgi:chromate transporter